jgi:hypothetical protein
MLFKETVAVYCENHTEHTNPDLTSQETHYVSATEANRLTLFREAVAVYYENHNTQINMPCGQTAEFWYVQARGTYHCNLNSYHSTANRTV